MFIKTRYYLKKYFIMKLSGDFPGVLMAKTPNAGAQVRSMVGELRSHMLHSTTKQIHKCK